MSFVTEKFYREGLHPACGEMMGNAMLTIKGANGLEINYTGYLKVDVTMGGVTVPGWGILTLKEIAATVERMGPFFFPLDSLGLIL